MRAIIIEEYGDAENFALKDIPIPTVAPGTVLLRVKGTSVNPVDLLTRSMGAPLAPDLPAILHSDVAGIVERVSDDVTSFEVGDEVYGCVGGVAGTPGTLAEYVLADANLLARKPATADMMSAAALPLVSITAWQAVFERARIEPGQKILVFGGSGGVGHIVIQLAKHVGAHVVATASSDAKRRIALECGADDVVNYKELPIESIVQDHSRGAGFDVVIDTVGGGNLANAFQATKMGGEVVTTVALGQVDLSQAHMRALSLHVVFMLIPLLHGVGRADHGKILSEIAGLVDAGKLKPVIDPSRFTMDQVAQAHELMESGAHVGKIVLMQN
jgi:NADPH2:quinone reductase